MKQRKKEEISHYEKLSERWIKKKNKNNWDKDIENYNINMLLSYNFCKNWLKQNITSNMKILDYGCGHGMHSILLAKLGAKVYGIDLSNKSLQIAKKRAEQEKINHKIKFIKGDCEKTEFPDNYFDIIWDGGTFSSLNIKKAFPELNRILKSNGKLIGIETFGHNPLINIKRWLNKKRGIRTKWAVEHIIKDKDLKFDKKNFNIEKISYFHLLAMFLFPFRNFLIGKKIFKFLDKIDYILLKNNWIKKYAFKIVFIFSKK